MKKRLRILIPALALIVGFLVWRLTHAGKPLYAGTVEATEVELSARVTSVIGAYQAVEGQTVAAQDPLVTLTCEDLRLAADLARKDFERGARLARQGSMPQEALDKLRFQNDDSALKVSWCEVRAPIPGTVLDVYHEAGERVTPGTPLLMLADLREVWAYVYVPQPLLARLSLGQQVEVYLPELKQTRAGRIQHLRSEAEFTPKNVQTRDERTRLVFGVKVALPNADGILKPGMTVEVRLPS